MTRSRRLFDALLQDTAAVRLLQRQYGADLRGMTLLRDNFNFVFGSERMILRFSPAYKKPLREVLTELRWTTFLAARDFLVNEVIPTREGKDYLEISVGKELLYVVAFIRSDGTPPEGEEFGPGLYRKLGDLTGRLHAASREFPVEAAANFRHWHEQSKTAAFPVLPDDDRELPKLLEKITQRLTALPHSPEEYGVIHYDIHHGNYFLLREQAGAPIYLFDFELTVRGWYLQDVSVVLYYLSNRNTMVGEIPRASFEANFLVHFGEAYRVYMPDLVFDEELIQTHLLYRDLFVYAFVLDAWRGQEISEKNERFMRLLEGNIAARGREF